eukprot:11349285-Alexandrium_andersonii.AAC.1
MVQIVAVAREVRAAAATASAATLRALGAPSTCGPVAGWLRSWRARADLPSHSHQLLGCGPSLR